MLPSIFGEDLFDDFFNDPFGMMNVSEGRSPLYGKHAKNLMKTNRQTINSIESGRYVPSTLLALKIAAYFGKTVNDIFQLEDGD